MKIFENQIELEFELSLREGNGMGLDVTHNTTVSVNLKCEGYNVLLMR